MPRIDQLPGRYPRSNWRTNSDWRHLREAVDRYIREYGLELNPDFQRGHVWTQEQQIKYVEFKLLGGVGSNEITLNCPRWSQGERDDFVLVDGLQRMTAALAFMNKEIKAFGYYYDEFDDWKVALSQVDFIFVMNEVPTRKAVIEWYIKLNSAGTHHTSEELDRVRALLK